MVDAPLASPDRRKSGSEEVAEGLLSGRADVRGRIAAPPLDAVGVATSASGLKFVANATAAGVAVVDVSRPAVVLGRSVVSEKPLEVANLRQYSRSFGSCEETARMWARF